MFTYLSMRFAASPLMVAVALGLLGPSVLEVEEESLGEYAPSEPDAAAEAPVEPADADE